MELRVSNDKAQSNIEEDTTGVSNETPVSVDGEAND